MQAFANLTNKFNDWEQGVQYYEENRIKEIWQVGKEILVHFANTTTKQYIFLLI